MPRCEFTARAVEDLREIGRYTKQAWGIAQTRRCREELELALKKLSLSPHAGFARDEIAVEIRSFRVASHLAFYLPRKDGITVLRLLHPAWISKAPLVPRRKNPKCASDKSSRKFGGKGRNMLSGLKIVFKSLNSKESR